MTLVDLVQFAAVAIGGGGVTALLGKWWERKDRRDESDHTKLKDCEHRCDELEEKVDSLEARLRAVEYASPSCFPRWIKDRLKRVIWLNDAAYMAIFSPLGLGREEVLGKTFGELLGDGAGDACHRLDDLDHAALADPWRAKSLLLQFHPDLPPMVVIKAAYPDERGEQRFEGASFVPNSPFAEQVGLARQREARTAAGEALLDRSEDR